MAQSDPPTEQRDERRDEDTARRYYQVPRTTTSQPVYPVNKLVIRGTVRTPRRSQTGRA